MAQKQYTTHVNAAGQNIEVRYGGIKGDYMSLTDMAKYRNSEATGLVISHWLSTRYAIEYLGIWEQVNNPDFNITEFSNIRQQAGSNGFVLTCKQWVERTNAKGIISSAGRYGGTYAHFDIAMEFASWLSPEFKFFVFKDYQRLKNDENSRLSLGWNLNRELSKINYRIHTDAIKENIIPEDISRSAQSFIYASEADVLNVALFGMTAKMWRETNPTIEGNIRDGASLRQLIVLINLESMNAELIKLGLPRAERAIRLNAMAIDQLTKLSEDEINKKLLGESAEITKTKLLTQNTNN